MTILLENIYSHNILTVLLVKINFHYIIIILFVFYYAVLMLLIDLYLMCQGSVLKQMSEQNILS